MRNCEERITDRCWEYARWLPEMQLYQPAMALILRTIAPTPPSARPAYTPLYKMLENAKLSQARSRSIALTKLLINRADFSTNHHPDRHPFMINNFFPINRSKENLKEQHTTKTRKYQWSQPDIFVQRFRVSSSHSSDRAPFADAYLPADHRESRKTRRRVRFTELHQTEKRFTTQVNGV